jgi:predicted phosphodiesterase
MPLRVLHLSDIHFSTKFEEEKIVHTDVRDELLSDLRDVMIPRLEGVDKVLIAGDIAFSGKRAEYDEAAIWLEQVTSACRCQRTDVLTVPGNHDVDRGRILPVTKVIHRRLRTCSLPEAKKELVDIAFQDDGSLTEKLSQRNLPIIRHSRPPTGASSNHLQNRDGIHPFHLKMIYCSSS